jgi:hypothetical protein
MKFHAAGKIWGFDKAQINFEEGYDFNINDPKKPFDELKSYLMRAFHGDKVFRARLLLECSSLDINDRFWYGAPYELSNDKINEFKRIVFETSLPTEGFKHLLLEFPWLSNSDLGLNYSLAFHPMSTDAVQTIWAWKRNNQSDLLLNERLLMHLKLVDN